MKMEVTFSLKTNEQYPGNISNMCSTECLTWAQKHLTSRQKQMFRSTCFGHLLDIQDLQFPAQLVHYLLLQEVETVGLKDEMWFLVEGRRIRFSKSEFEIITGLKMGKIPPLPAMQDREECRLMETYFPEGVEKAMRLRHWFGLVQNMEPSKIEDKDAVAITLYYVLERFILGHDKKKFVSLQLLNFVENWDTVEFQEHPWGAVAWQVLHRSMSSALSGRLAKYKQRLKDKQGQHKEEKYSLEGCTSAFHVWLYEAIPHIGEGYAMIPTPVREKLPRILRWTSKKLPVFSDIVYDILGKWHSDRPLVILRPYDDEGQIGESSNDYENIVTEAEEVELPVESRDRRKKELPKRRTSQWEKVHYHSTALVEDDTVKAQRPPARRPMRPQPHSPQKEAVHHQTQPLTPPQSRVESAAEGQISISESFMRSMMAELASLRSELTSMRASDEEKTIAQREVDRRMQEEISLVRAENKQILEEIKALREDAKITHEKTKKQYSSSQDDTPPPALDSPRVAVVHDSEDQLVAAIGQDYTPGVDVHEATSVDFDTPQVVVLLDSEEQITTSTVQVVGVEGDKEIVPPSGPRTLHGRKIQPGKHLISPYVPIVPRKKAKVEDKEKLDFFASYDPLGALPSDCDASFDAWLHDSKELLDLGVAEADVDYFTPICTHDGSLEDKHMNSYLYLLRMRLPSTTCIMDTWFHQTLSAIWFNHNDELGNLDKIPGTFLHKALKYVDGMEPKHGVIWSNVDKVYMPLNFANEHWVAACVHVKERVLEVFDSCARYCTDEKMKEMTRDLRYLIPRVIQRSMFGPHPYESTPLEFRRVTKGVPQQIVGGMACGVFTCRFIELLASDIPLSAIETFPEDVLRRRMAIELWMAGVSKYLVS